MEKIKVDALDGKEITINEAHGLNREQCNNVKLISKIKEELKGAGFVMIMFTHRIFTVVTEETLLKGGVIHAVPKDMGFIIGRGGINISRVIKEYNIPYLNVKPIED